MIPCEIQVIMHMTHKFLLFSYFTFYVHFLFSIDGSTSNQNGKFVNDSLHGNSVMRKINCSKSDIRLCLFASKDILEGTELRYNYGDDEDIWWRKEGSFNKPLNIQAIENNSCEMESNDELDVFHWTKYKDLQSVPCEVVKVLVEKCEETLKGIFTGKEWRKRCDIYKQRGRARESLTNTVRFGAFTKEQIDVIVKTLLEIFCPNNSTKNFDFVFKVLLPETVTLIYSRVNEISVEEAEEQVSNVGISVLKEGSDSDDGSNKESKEHSENEFSHDVNCYPPTDDDDISPKGKSILQKRLKAEIFIAKKERKEKDGDSIGVSTKKQNNGEYYHSAFEEENNEEEEEEEKKEDMNLKNKNGFEGNKRTKLKCLKQDGRKKKVTAKKRLKNKKVPEMPSTKRRAISAKEVWKIVNERNRQDDWFDTTGKSDDNESNTPESDLEENVHAIVHTLSKKEKRKKKESDEIMELKKSMEVMRKRLEKAEKAAEREYTYVEGDNENDDDDVDMSVQKSENTSEEIRKTHKILSHGKILANKRKAERKRKKMLACVNKYVGPPGTIKERKTGVIDYRKVYDIKCPVCSVVSSRLYQHLMLQHKFSDREAKLKESEVRVMFLWSKKEKHGIPKPLPCAICGVWHLRLRTHLKRKHKFEGSKITEILETARKENWANEGCLENKAKLVKTANQKAKKRTKCNREELINTGRTIKYLPDNAKEVNASNKADWDIEGDNFLMYYETGEELLEAFKSEVEKKKGAVKAKRYRQHVEYIWTIIDPNMAVIPASAFANCLLVEDKYHDPTYRLIGKGGNEASTLRVRYVALRAFIRFLRRRHVYGGITRDQMTALSEYIDEWNADFTESIAQRKTDIRRIKIKRLMTPTHMIKYGRSNFVQGLVKSIERVAKSEKPTKRFCQQVRDYLITNLCIMNGLRSSNLIELRVSDVQEAHTSEEYPGYMVFTNSRYKTSTIYGEKVIVLPKNVFEHLKYYVKEIRPVLNPTTNTYLFISSDTNQLSHATIGSSLTSSFKNAAVFGKHEYDRVSPTRIRCACATFGCKVDGIDSGYFAKHFMKNKEDTTNIHYNLYSNHREALKLAMMMGNTFEVGGVTQTLKKEDVEKITSAILKNEKVMPCKDDVIEWVSKNNSLEPKELSDFMDILEELEGETNRIDLFYNKNGGNVKKKDAKKSVAVPKTTLKTYPKRKQKPPKGSCLVLQHQYGEDSIGSNSSNNDDSSEEDDNSICEFSAESLNDISDENLQTMSEVDDCEVENHPLKDSLDEKIAKYETVKKNDLVKGRKHCRTMFLGLTYVCEELMKRKDYDNVSKTKTFTANEVKRCISKNEKMKEACKGKDADYWKYLVLNMREKYQRAMKREEYCKCRQWLNEAKDMMNHWNT
ncbi:uncharacterized protein LOC130636789 isoform X2 [Hydractinia symbiolongicarpus]|uniref:uncharacterized protein LOC130636789 isoform X2 n=1 Tax=Hydractinia symbiolongicarpus TaxID=13093 RepID=UPI00254C0265|nr:uncharacterized protein LOC130636789 isoform X2 [Hydractinia symbiolongicarpus]